MSWFEGFEARTITANGVDIFFRCGGNPHKPALVLLHGFPQTHVMWHRVAQRLRDAYFLVLPDVRGYGASSHAPGLSDHSNYSKRAMAADVVAVADALGLDRFFLCGHDRGGRVAHRLALDHARRVRRLCVMDIAPTLDMYASTNMEFARAYYHWFHLVQPSPLPEDMIGGNAKAYLHLEHDRASRAHGDTIACDTLVLWGERGVVQRLFRPMDLWQAQCSATVEGQTLPAGHFIPEELPELTADALRGFMR